MADDASSMSASASSLPPSKLCSKTYKKASQLFLTRRLEEALVSLEPVISASSSNDEQEVNGAPVAPIATVPATWRIKIWNLYITLLSAIIDLGPEEGKMAIGQKEWKDISTQVRDGSIWEKVVQIGYQGREGSVDAEVVYNLGTLLLNQSPSQTINQQRLEAYLSSYGQPNLDIEEHLNSPQRQHFRSNGGTDTPKDLAARVRLIELFTLHVLPRNEEWDYATQFIEMSEVLDEERKEVFFQTLDGLKEEKEQGKLRAAALQREKDAELERQIQEAERQKAEEAAAAERASQSKGHKRSGSEVDYGIEKTNPNGSLRGKKGDKTGSGKSGSSRTALSPPNSKNLKKPEKPETRARQSKALVTVLRNLAQYLGKSISNNPLSFLRSILFVLGLIFALNRPNVRERIRRIVGSSWQKVRGTVGMGVKVSYI
ncbi:protein pex26 [Aspergillus stella-maris]|uniref:protein pex26 n=1 Tax=Aspergillus stella-maris TaxID=1810926 RepID=UPI003CCD6F75